MIFLKKRLIFSSLIIHFFVIQCSLKSYNKPDMTEVFKQIKDPEIANKTLKTHIVNGVPVINKKFDYIEKDDDEQQYETENFKQIANQNTLSSNLKNVDDIHFPVINKKFDYMEEKEEDYFNFSPEYEFPIHNTIDDAYEENYNHNDIDNENNTTEKETSLIGTIIWSMALIASWLIKKP